MLALGIDPGTAITGYALVRQEAAEPELLLAGVIRTASSEPLPARLQVVYAGVAALAREHQPQAAAVEEIFFRRNVRTALAVGHARGVVLLALADARVPIYEYKPAEVKQSLTGYGGADKAQVQRMLRLVLRLPDILSPDDAADAAAIALCHLQHERFGDAVRLAGLKDKG